jgi:hypothetical protein
MRLSEEGKRFLSLTGYGRFFWFKKLTIIFMKSLAPTCKCRGFPHLFMDWSSNSRVRATVLGSFVKNLFLKHLAASLAL